MHRYGLYALQWIVEVNGKPTPDLEAFVNVTKVRLIVHKTSYCFIGSSSLKYTNVICISLHVQEIENEEFVRVKTVHLNGKPCVLTLKQDLHYWPTWELSFDPETAMWQRKTIKAL